jgi:Fe-S cluster assembly protein SufD
MDTLTYYKKRFEQLGNANGNGLSAIRRNAFDAFSKMGVPTSRHEEWKYTRISSLFNKEYEIPGETAESGISPADLDGIRLPGYGEANELFFVNGIYSPELSVVRSPELQVQTLEKAAAGEHAAWIKAQLGHSASYLKDGINALNTAFAHGGAFLKVKKGSITEHPVYIYNITDARGGNMLSQPRSLIHVTENAQVSIVETYASFGKEESFSNQVMEVVIERDAMLEYYKIQNDESRTGQVSTTHIRQSGKSHVHAVTVTLGGKMVRNNLNIVMEEQHSEAHMYGFYFPEGDAHVDNHTIVDNVAPNCYSNELYKGVMKENSTGVFNGKIFVRQQAQKTNAYQSNKNILLSPDATINTKPQLEIFADDVKCSHGCTVGKLDEEGLFYLRSRGVPESIARSLLLHGFALDILEQIRPEHIRNYVDRLISERLELL